MTKSYLEHFGLMIRVTMFFLLSSSLPISNLDAVFVSVEHNVDLITTITVVLSLGDHRC